MSEHDYAEAAGGRDFPNHPASLPYAGTSGFSGTDASMERALDRDASGKTGLVQGEILIHARLAGVHGITIKMLRTNLPGEHHGTLSGALTALHQNGRLIRLTEQRDRCSVYVLPQYIDGRDTVDPAKPKRREVLEIRPGDTEYWVGRQAQLLLMNCDEVVVRWQK